MGFSTQNNLDMSIVGLFGGGTNKNNLYNQIIEEISVVVSKTITLANGINNNKIGTVPKITTI